MLPGRLAALPPSSFAMLSTLLDSVKPGAPVVSLAVGDPRGTPPPFVMEALNRHAGEFGEYPAVNGTKDWRDAAASWVRRRFELPETSIDPEKHVLPLNGTREGLFLAPYIVTPETKAGARLSITGSRTRSGCRCKGQAGVFDLNLPSRDPLLTRFVFDDGTASSAMRLALMSCRVSAIAC